MIKSIEKENELTSHLYLRDKHFKYIRRKQFIRLIITYILPFLILTAYFYYELNNQYNHSAIKNLKIISENKTYLLENFLSEKIQILKTMSDISLNPSDNNILGKESFFSILKKSDSSFFDIQLFDSNGNVIFSSDKFNNNVAKNGMTLDFINSKYDSFLYCNETEKSDNRNLVMAIKVWKNDKMYVALASLNPEFFKTILYSNQSKEQYNYAIINNDGMNIIASKLSIKAISKIKLEIVNSKYLNYGELKIADYYYDYTVKDIKQADLKLVVLHEQDKSLIPGVNVGIITISILFLFILLGIVTYRAYKIAQMQIEKDITRNQLEHASKLASIGELVSGIAHEINNPLAIIAAEAGLIKDMTNPIFNFDFSIEKMTPHLTSIHDAAFRGRDITKKLLSFVRNDKIELKEYDINQIIDDLIEGFFTRELKSSNIKIERYSNDKIPLLVTEANQLTQVLINIINNAVDAISPPGVILIETSYDEKYVIIAITDTGHGIKDKDMNKIFMPFFTTKDVGKGTGLGLSVSYGIIKNLGGVIEVESVLDTGATFIIKLPY